MKMVFMVNRTRALVIAVAATLTPLVAGCANAGPAGGADGGLTVVTSAYPFQFVAERVAGSNATVTNLTAPGAEPHDLELTPRQVGSLSDAGLVVYERGFQPAVDEAVEQSGAGTVLDTTTVVPLEKLGTGDDHEHEGAEGAEHEGEHAEGEEHAGEHDHGAAGGLDPHVWLDPTKLATIATAVADRLAAVDPDHAAAYRTNAEALGVELTALDSRFRSGLTDCRQTEFITSHTAFGYLAKRYGLVQIGISGISPDTEPSPARIAEVQKEAAEHQVTTIFTETLASPAVADAIAGDLGLRTDVLDPIEGITDASRGRDYVAVMDANLVALQEANGCPRA